MRELIKQIREYTRLSQTEMAKKIGVQFATINRWENGHSKPTRLAEEGLFDLCEKLNVPVYIYCNPTNTTHKVLHIS